MSNQAFGPWMPDVQTIGTNNVRQALNVVPTSNGYGPFRSISELTGALPARCCGWKTVVGADGNIHLFAGTATGLFKINPVTLAWANVSGGSYTLTDRDFWWFIQFGDNVIAGSTGILPQRYQLNISATFANLGGSPPRARSASVVGDQVVLYLDDRVMWSGINDITGWTIGVNSCDQQPLPDGGYAQTGTNGEFGFIFQERSIRRMIANPGPEIFDISVISSDRGILMPYSMVEAHSSVFFLSSDGFWRIDANGGFTPIGFGQVNEYIIKNADLTNPRFVIGGADPKFQRVFWAFRSISTLDPNILDRILIYDWVLNRWSLAAVSVEFVGQNIPLAITLDGLDASYPGGIDSIPVSLDSFDSSRQARLAGFTTNHKLGFFEGVALEAIVETPDISGGRKRTKTQYAAPMTDADSCMVSTGHRELMNETMVYSQERAPSARTGYASVRGSGRYVSHKVRIPANQDWTFIKSIDLQAAEGGNL